MKLSEDNRDRGTQILSSNDEFCRDSLETYTKRAFSPRDILREESSEKFQEINLPNHLLPLQGNQRRTSNMDSLTIIEQNRPTIDDRNKQLEQRLVELETQLKEKRLHNFAATSNSMSLLIDGMNTKELSHFSNVKSDTGMIDRKEFTGNTFRNTI
jgi:hypothetical protein